MVHGPRLLLSLLSWSTITAQGLGAEQMLVPPPVSGQNIGVGKPIVADSPAPKGTDPSVMGLSQELDQLRAARQSLQELRRKLNDESREEDDMAAERSAQLRSRLLKLMGELTRRQGAEADSEPAPEAARPRQAKQSAGPVDEKESRTAVVPVETGEVVDAPALAQSLMRTGQIEAALAHLNSIDLSSVPEKDQIILQYLTATCLRRLGKAKEAKEIYRQIAASKEDEQLAECAKWQLHHYRRLEELSGQLEVLKQRRQALGKNR